jgi:hypothetical protein
MLGSQHGALACWQVARLGFPTAAFTSRAGTRLVRQVRTTQRPSAQAVPVALARVLVDAGLQLDAR